MHVKKLLVVMSVIVLLLMISTCSAGSASDEGMVPDPVYNLRDTGPAGGLIFYINQNAAVDGWTYLECAPQSTEWTGKKWGGLNVTIAGADGLTIGTGAQNTADIVGQIGATTPECAAMLCSNLNFNGYDNWFLPSRDELNQMYVNLDSEGVGNFADGYYWSSSENIGSNLYAYCLNFNDGSSNGVVSKSYTEVRTRAIRAF